MKIRIRSVSRLAQGLLVSSALLLAAPARAAGPVAIEFLQQEQSDGSRPAPVVMPIPPKAALALDLGDNLDRIRVRGLAILKGEELIIEQRFETSVSLSNEGPHQDLTEWKHGRTGWRRLVEVAPAEFQILEVSPDAELPFPEVTAAEIVAALKKKKDVEPRWFELAAQCRTARTAPCAVGVSRISFRISRKSQGRSKVLWRADLLPPMGC